ncbi:MAG: hypothetical protein HS116_04855 [Planctomycetes bacterium]|nr:hypothetical protein [Planctomycetota bacterium]
MSDTPETQPPVGPTSPPAAPDTDAAAERAATPSRPHRREMTPRPPYKDRSMLLIVGIVIFIFLMIVNFLYTLMVSTRPIRFVKAKDPMRPVPELVRADDVKDLGADRWELTYNFEKYKAEREKLTVLLKDFKGWRNDPNSDEWKTGEHRPISLDAQSGLPVTPLLTEVSWQDEMEIEAAIEPRQDVPCALFFNYFYTREHTGTALLLNPDGQAQFVRYRKAFDYDSPTGTPGRFTFEKNKTMIVKVVVKNFPHSNGYRCEGYVDGHLVAQAEFPPEWPKDRRIEFDPLDQEAMSLVADMDVPPRSGFVALYAGAQPRLLEALARSTHAKLLHAVRILRLTVRGTVAETWRADRTRTLDILDDHERAAQKQIPPPEAE